MTRVYVIDDHPMMRKGIVLTIGAEADLEVCGQASSAEEAMSAIEKIQPDVIIVDISLPGMSGIEFVKQVGTLYPNIHLLVVSRHDEALYAERAVRAGARGYIMKLDAGDNIVQAIRRIRDGGLYVSQDVSDRLLMSLAGGRKTASASPLEVLSDRELEVFEMTGKGASTREIAEQFHLSVKTVESYKTRIKNKLNLDTSADLMRHAVQWVSSERSPGEGA